MTPEDGKIRRVCGDKRSETSQHTVKPTVLVPLLSPKNNKVTNRQTLNVGVVQQPYTGLHLY